MALVMSNDAVVCNTRKLPPSRSPSRHEGASAAAAASLSSSSAVAEFFPIFFRVP